MSAVSPLIPASSGEPPLVSRRGRGIPRWTLAGANKLRPWQRVSRFCHNSGEPPLVSRRGVSIPIQSLDGSINSPYGEDSISIACRPLLIRRGRTASNQPPERRDRLRRSGLVLSSIVFYKTFLAAFHSRHAGFPNSRTANTHLVVCGRGGGPGACPGAFFSPFFFRAKKEWVLRKT